MIITHFFHCVLNQRASVHNVFALGVVTEKLMLSLPLNTACLWPDQFPGPQPQKAPRSAQQYSIDLTMNMTNTALALHAHPSCDAMDSLYGEQSCSVFLETFRCSNQPWDKFACVRDSDTTQTKILSCPYSSLALDDYRVSMMFFHLEPINNYR